MTGWCMVLVSRCRGDKGRSQKGHRAAAAADGEMRADRSAAPEETVQSSDGEGNNFFSLFAFRSSFSDENKVS